MVVHSLFRCTVYFIKNLYFFIVKNSNPRILDGIRAANISSFFFHWMTSMHVYVYVYVCMYVFMLVWKNVFWYKNKPIM